MAVSGSSRHDLERLEVIDIDSLMTDYVEASDPPLRSIRSQLATQTYEAPHRPPALHSGNAAIYVFALSDQSGESCQAGADRALKVGKVGARSGPRYQSQHYNPRSARSNLAKSLITYRVLWPYLGIDHIDEHTVKSWMCSNLDRYSVFMPADQYEVHGSLLETYLRGRLGPVFEGSA